MLCDQDDADIHIPLVAPSKRILVAEPIGDEDYDDLSVAVATTDQLVVRVGAGDSGARVATLRVGAGEPASWGTGPDLRSKWGVLWLADEQAAGAAVAAGRVHQGDLETPILQFWHDPRAVASSLALSDDASAVLLRGAPPAHVWLGRNDVGRATVIMVCWLR